MNYSTVVHSVYYTASDGTWVGIMDWRNARMDVRRAIHIYETLIHAKMPLVVRCENHNPAESWSQDLMGEANIRVCPHPFRYEDGTVWSKDWKL